MNRALRKAYDVWHCSLNVDLTATTPWHGLVQRHLDPTRDICGKTILEIGCGRGELAFWLAAQPFGPHRIVAADISPVAVGKGRAFALERKLRGIEWEVGDIHNLAHASRTFDTVISCETIEHLPEPGRALAELARVLRVGGHLFLTTPNYLGVMGLYRLYLRLTGRKYQEEGQPLNRLTLWPRTLAWVKSAGLVVESLDGVGHYILRRGRAPRPIRTLDRLRWLTRWTALHSLTVAAKR